ncbi:hypothetical protein Cni_G06967 [Canna indica]|uniref:L27 domain-containing protein n=1 Tax=Canna indica TaxID=4628 RepID=A0AAQ3Q6Y0_9LILI|nr:hypothetical protein Cni_G06967 [Canna indica]
MALLSLFDHLYCQEDDLELEEADDERKEPMLPPLEDDGLLVSAVTTDAEWAEVLCSLAAREVERAELVPDGTGNGDSYLRSARKDAVEWVAAAAARHGFSALTALLAVDYLDRCFLCAGGGGLRLQDDKPWMGRLAAVACLSLAAKVEETDVPLLVDLQVPPSVEAAVPEEGGYVFDPKTIRRMELLVLSTLGWRMNPVTPFSFIHHLLLRLRSRDKNADAGATAARVRWMATRCEALLLSAIPGGLTSKCFLFIELSIYFYYYRNPKSPSSSSKNGDGSNIRHRSGRRRRCSRQRRSPASQERIPKKQTTSSSFSTLQRSDIFFRPFVRQIRLILPLFYCSSANEGINRQEKVDECHQLILRSVGAAKLGHKRKLSSFYHYSPPPSPSGVVGSCFSCENSCDSWAMRVPSSPASPAHAKRRLPP